MRTIFPKENEDSSPSPQVLPNISGGLVCEEATVKFPKRLRHRGRGRVLATIYKRSESPPYRLYWRTRVDGKPRSQTKDFSSYSDAKRAGDTIVASLATGSQASSLSPGQASDALAALERLQAYYQATGRRISLIGAVSEFAEASARLMGRTLGDAVDGYLTTVINVKREDLRKAVNEFITSEEPRTLAGEGQRAQVSSKYHYNRAIMLRRVAAAFPNTAVSDLTKAHLDAFFSGLGKSVSSKSRNRRPATSAKSRNHHRAVLRQFLDWAVRKDYLGPTHRLNEADGMRRERANTAETEFYTPDEFRALLKYSDCRKAYTETLAVLAETYSSALEQSGFEVNSFAPQSHIFADRVSPLLKAGEKVAYLLVDALRFEMAAELVAGMGDEFEITTHAAIGQLPGITPIGMAALMPGAEKGLALDKGGAGLVVQIQGQPVTTRIARMDWLKAQVDTPLVICKLGEIARLTPRRKKELTEPKFIVVTSQEIDRHGEEASDEEETRLYMDEVLDKLRRGIRNLLQVGVRHIVIAADHGFIFAEGLDAGLSMDAPGGETVELHSRAWIGRGGISAHGFFRSAASDVELGGPLELAFPRSIGLFKVKGGSGPYFHGGPTLQEQIIPVCLLKARKVRTETGGELKLELKLAKPKVTNRFFSLTVTLTAEGLFGETQKRIRLEALSAKTEVGYAAVASYGYEEGTREIAIASGKPNAVTMMLTAKDAVTKISIRAIDCETQLVFGELTDIPVELAI